MKCPRCQTQTAKSAKYCSECGFNVKTEVDTSALNPSSGLSAQEDLTGSSTGEGALKPPSGFRRTLSTELVARQTELRTLLRLSTLVESQSYGPGEVMIHKGEKKRDLYFLTEGVVEISRKEGGGDLILDEVEAPNILGDIAFLSGTPRAVTVVAKTEVKTFVLKYEDFSDLFKGPLSWVHPLLTSFGSGIKSLHHKTKILERKLLEIMEQNKNQT